MEIIRGDDADFELTFKDIDGNPIDLTGATVFFTVKRHKTDSDTSAVLKKEITTFTLPLTGVALLELTDTETDLTPGSYYFDVQLKDTIGKITSSYSGRLLVFQDITTRTDIS